MVVKEMSMAERQGRHGEECPDGSLWILGCWARSGVSMQSAVDGALLTFGLGRARRGRCVCVWRSAVRRVREYWVFWGDGCRRGR